MQGLTLGILGLGTVGSGVVKILRQNREVLERRVGIPLSIKRIAVRDLKAKRATEVEAELLTTDPWAVVRDPEHRHHRRAHGRDRACQEPHS